VTIAAEAVQQPGASRIAAFLSRYFTAINSHDYQAYAALFLPGGQQLLSLQFHSAYQSTTDSAVTLTGLESAGAGLAARVTFKSHQPPAISITSTACTSWHVTFYLTQSGSWYLIASPPASYRPSARPCS
jgi:hypothetical protein